MRSDQRRWGVLPGAKSEGDLKKRRSWNVEISADALQALRQLRFSEQEAAQTIRGVPSEVLLTERDGMKAICAINLHNVVTVSKAHLGRRVAMFSSERLREICAALGFALGCA